MRRMTLKGGAGIPQLSLEPGKAAAQISRLKSEGISALEIFAPYYGGRSFGGLDPINYFRIDPSLGTMKEFRDVVRLAHAKGLAVTVFVNLGYSSVDSPFFLKAEGDIREGKHTRQADSFLWSNSAQAPPPGHNNRYFMVRPNLPRYNAAKDEFWQWSSRAKHYYWTKWAGVDNQGRPVRLPQYNWASPGWQNEAAKIVRFWMNTGIDGMVVDAVNWYNGITWKLNRKDITDLISSYGSEYSQPEGAGGFQDNPVAWITEGGWDSVQDYGLGIWWEKGTNVIANAIRTGDPQPMEAALRNYHDRVVAVGGTLYRPVQKMDNETQDHLALATTAAVGDLVCFCGGKRDISVPDKDETWVLKLKQTHPALQQNSLRRKLPTQDDKKFYAFLQTAKDGSDRVLVVLNFQRTPQTIDVDISGVATSGLVDLETHQVLSAGDELRVRLSTYGYKFYEVRPALQ